MRTLRTPDERFQALPDFPFEPHFLEVPDGEGGRLRIACVDEGPPGAAECVLLLHGEPTWSYLYRKMIPLFVRRGVRAVALDLVGCGRSDKPGDPEDYSYERHVAWIAAAVRVLDLRGVTLVAQDWGGLIGLRVATEDESRFSRIAIANTGLPVGGQPRTGFFEKLLRYAEESPDYRAGNLVSRWTRQPLSPGEEAAYDAPYPSADFMRGVRRFKRLIPFDAESPTAVANRRSWEVLRRWEKPFLTAWSDGERATAGLERAFQQQVPGARGRAHPTIASAGHFLQEDQPEAFAEALLRFIDHR